MSPQVISPRSHSISRSLHPEVTSPQYILTTISLQPASVDFISFDFQSFHQQIIHHLSFTKNHINPESFHLNIISLGSFHNEILSIRIVLTQDHFNPNHFIERYFHTISFQPESVHAIPFISAKNHHESFTRNHFTPRSFHSESFHQDTPSPRIILPRINSHHFTSPRISSTESFKANHFIPNYFTSKHLTTNHFTSYHFNIDSIHFISFDGKIISAGDHFTPKQFTARVFQYTSFYP